MSLCRKRQIRFQEWYRATQTAGRVFHDANGWVATARLIYRVGRLVAVAVVTRRMVPKSVWFHRMRSCMGCPIYNRADRTCGSVGEVNWQGKQIGCLCWMPFKARFSEAGCWLAEAQVGDTRWRA